MYSQGIPETISLALPADLKSRLERIAASDNRSLQNYIFQLLQDIARFEVVTHLPPGIPTPQFRLFQTVQVEDTQGVVVALEYVDAVTSLIQGYGWRYIISFTFGQRPEAIATTDIARRDKDPVADLWESELQSFNPAE